MTHTGRFVEGVEAMRLLTERRRDETAATPMEESIWIGTCAEVLADPARLCAGVVDGEGEPYALAGFVARGDARLEMLGVRDLHEPSDVVHRAPGALDALLETIARTGRALFLPRIDAGSPTVAAIEKIYRRGVMAARPVSGAPFLALEPGIDPLPRLSPSLRADLRRGRRRAEALGPVECEVLEPDASALPGLWAEFERVEASGWKGREGSALAKDKRRGWFFRVYARRAAERGTLRIGRLRIAERTAAVQIAVETAGALWLLKIGYDEALASCSPGNLLMSETLAWSARRGLRSYELLGQSAPWTRRWTETEHACVAVRAYAASGRAFVALGGDVIRSAWGKLWSA